MNNYRNIKPGNLVTLIKAHPDHNKWFGLVLREDPPYKRVRLLTVLGPSFYNETKNMGLIEHEIYDCNLSLIEGIPE